MTNPERTAIEELANFSVGEPARGGDGPAPMGDPLPDGAPIGDPPRNEPVDDPDDDYPIDDPGQEEPIDDDPTDDSPDYIDDTLSDRLDDEHRRPRGPSDIDEPPDYIEGNDPEDALRPTDPDGPMVDRQDPDAGIKQIKDHANPDSRSPA